MVVRKSKVRKYAQWDRNFLSSTFDTMTEGNLLITARKFVQKMVHFWNGKFLGETHRYCFSPAVAFQEVYKATNPVLCWTYVRELVFELLFSVAHPIARKLIPQQLNGRYSIWFSTEFSQKLPVDAKVCCWSLQLLPPFLKFSKSAMTWVFLSHTLPVQNPLIIHITENG